MAVNRIAGGKTLKRGLPISHISAEPLPVKSGNYEKCVLFRGITSRGSLTRPRIQPVRLIHPHTRFLRGQRRDLHRRFQDGPQLWFLPIKINTKTKMRRKRKVRTSIEIALFVIIFGRDCVKSSSNKFREGIADETVSFCSLSHFHSNYVLSLFCLGFLFRQKIYDGSLLENCVPKGCINKILH